MQNIYDIDDLIAKVLAEEASDAEKAELDRWVEASAENRVYFEDMRKIWDFSYDAAAPLDVDVDVAWAKVQTHIQAEPKVITAPLRTSWRSNGGFLRAAAAIAVLLVAGWWLFIKPSASDAPLSIVASAEPVEQVLKDGSDIKVSPQSKLVAAFSDKERRVKLEGEAFFKVAPNAEKPFFVEVKTLEIKVVGTQFNVDEKSQAGKVIVTVTEGKVMLKNARGESTYLTKDMRAIFDAQSGQFDVEELSPTQHEMLPSLNFWDNAKPLKSVAKDLEKYFKTTVTIASPAIENCLVKVDFSGKKIETIFDVLSETYDFEISKTANGFAIKGNGCGE